MTIEKHYSKEVYRKLFHLSSIWIPIVIWYLPYEYALALFTFLFLILFTTESLRLYSKSFYNLFIAVFGKLMREHEKNNNKSSFIGSYYVILAALLALILFSKAVAIISIAIMVVSDAIAALVGRKFGKHKIMNKSLEGSFAYFVSGVITVIFICYSLSAGTNLILSGMLAVLTSTLVELFSSKLKIDDNLAIVLVAGITMELGIFLLSLF